MNGQAWLTGASHLPAPLFVLIVGALAIFSVGGIPVPITVTLLFAGALSTRLPNGGLLFIALVVVLTAALTLRDGITLLLGRHGGRLFAWRPRRRATAFVQHEAILVRSAHITLPAARVQGQAQRRARRAKMLASTQAILLHQGVVVLALTRLSPLASPFDIAAGMLGMSLRRYLPPIAVGRMLYCILLLGAGVLSATAWGHGASLPQLAAIISVIVIALIVLPSILSRRLIARTAPAMESGVVEEPVMASR